MNMETKTTEQVPPTLKDIYKHAPVRTRIESARTWSERQLKRMWVGLWMILGVSTTGGGVSGFLIAGTLLGVIGIVAGIVLTALVIMVWNRIIAHGVKKRLNSNKKGA